jgi:ABC-type Fe3+-siderophore transport system permease subunit
MLLIGIVVTLKSTNVQSAVRRHRMQTCSWLPLPSSASLYCGIGLAIGAVALVLLIAWFRHDWDPLVTILAITAVAGILFELFTLLTALFEPAVPPCVY